MLIYLFNNGFSNGMDNIGLNVNLFNLFFVNSSTELLTITVFYQGGLY